MLVTKLMKALAAKTVNLAFIPRTTWQRKQTNSDRLSSDQHIDSGTLTASKIHDSMLKFIMLINSESHILI